MKLNLYVGYTLIVFLFVGIFFLILSTWNSGQSNSNNSELLPNPEDCPNVLLRKGKQLMLINTRRPKINGVNPIYLKGLDDYVAYMKQQNVILNQSCPILFLQQEREGHFTKMKSIHNPTPLSCPSPPPAEPSPSPAPSAPDSYAPAPSSPDSYAPAPSSPDSYAPAPSSPDSYAPVAQDCVPSPAYDPIPVDSVTPPFSSHYETLSDTDFADLIKYTSSVAPAMDQRQQTSLPQQQLPQVPQQQHVPQVPQQQHVPQVPQPPQYVPQVPQPPQYVPQVPQPPQYVPQQQQQAYIPSQQPPPQQVPIPMQMNNPTPPKPFSQASFPHPPTARPYIVPESPPPTSPVDEFANVQPTPYVDASRDDAPFNQFMYTGFDPINLHAGVYSTVDKIHYSTRKDKPFSDNAMDPNWGGVQYTKKQVNSGKYDDNTVTSTIYTTTPNTFMLPSFRPLLDNADSQTAQQQQQQQPSPPKQ